MWYIQSIQAYAEQHKHACRPSPHRAFHSKCRQPLHRLYSCRPRPPLGHQLQYHLCCRCWNRPQLKTARSRYRSVQKKNPVDLVTAEKCAACTMYFNDEGKDRKNISKDERFIYLNDKILSLVIHTCKELEKIYNPCSRIHYVQGYKKYNSYNRQQAKFFFKFHLLR